MSNGGPGSFQARWAMVPVGHEDAILPIASATSKSCRVSPTGTISWVPVGLLDPLQYQHHLTARIDVIAANQFEEMLANPVVTNAEL